jgi:hypothetical protein
MQQLAQIHMVIATPSDSTARLAFIVTLLDPNQQRKG